ncbi:MAG: hypothetical protein K0S85_2062 [Pseudomonas orientalis]|nr:hypothetical protein [Pseudomonas orientalis]
MAVGQSVIGRLLHSYRGQAPSHIFYSSPDSKVVRRNKTGIDLLMRS